MKNEAMIIELGKLEGYTFQWGVQEANDPDMLTLWDMHGSLYSGAVNFLRSREKIFQLIAQQPAAIKAKVVRGLIDRYSDMTAECECLFWKDSHCEWIWLALVNSHPKTMAEVLLQALDKWVKDENDFEPRADTLDPDGSVAIDDGGD